jgi:threonine/homoserine/homoserine lactone efflux protein
MFDIHNYAAFIGAIIVFHLLPGPGTVAILHATARGGIGAGMGAVCGTLLGDLVYMTAAVSGLAALLVAQPELFSLVRWVGILMLCRIGWKLQRASVADTHDDVNVAGDGWTALRRAFMVGLTNPKVVLFFMSFFPLFMAAGTGPGTLVVMMLHVSLICLLYQTCLVMVGDRLARRLSGLQRLRGYARRLAGIALIGFGVRLAIERN